jgi:hypothetical protein
MKAILCYVGQQLVFEQATEMVLKLTGSTVNAKQIERLCHCYGEKLEEQQEKQIAAGENPAGYFPKQLHYLMLDGGMLLTREDGWKEMKLCRIFSADQIAQVSKGRKQIIQSNYIGHLGSHKEFLKKVEHHGDAIPHKAIVADGAPWIWNWADDVYPGSIQILDFYHAKEHLCNFAEHQFKEVEEKQKWINHQSLRLLNDQIEKVIADLKTMTPRGTQSRKIKIDLINYYQRNSKRMQYRSFKEKGLLIGSGAIEAAHRHVIQQRMKLSGQRWTKKGAQQIANLRMANKSDQWDSVIKIINLAA